MSNMNPTQDDYIDDCIKQILIFGLDFDKKMEFVKSMNSDFDVKDFLEFSVSQFRNKYPPAVYSVWQVLEKQVAKDCLSQGKQNNILIRCCVDYLKWVHVKDNDDEEED